ncbi:Hypothetical protein Tpal_487 [Trichococcus palustris]|uniref:Uncharacterized protein n=1 Tax=Trichococcus palustris TaxID=140314 RepID=A0A143Y7G4_9LACT|nr:Hypothetical protein Tpal_487 [Trichococcus palustris]SFK70572.1 Protein of unknown function [Trichococcus palustris]
MSKYGAKKVTIDGITFDSKAESRYYEYLLKLKKSGLVEDFSMQHLHYWTGLLIRRRVESCEPSPTGLISKYYTQMAG